MFRLAVLSVILALASGHAVVPVLPAVHAVHTPLVLPYPLSHGYGHGYYGHGLIKPFGHHLLKRHIIAPYAHPVAPLAVSHQSRVDYHSSPAFAPIPYVKPLLTPLVAAPLLHKPLIAPHYGLGHEGLYTH